MPDRRPPYQRIAADLRAQIIAGDFPAGAKLLSTPQLAERYDAVGGTVQNAIDLLREEGYVRSRAGSGVYSRDRELLTVRAGAYIKPHEGGYTYDILNVQEEVPPAWVATALELPTGGTAVLRHRLTNYAGEPIEVNWSWYPSDLALGTALAGRRRIRGGAPAVLEQQGHPVADAVDEITARMPTTEEVDLLNMAASVPVLRQWRVITSSKGRPVEASVMVKGAHRCVIQCKPFKDND